MSSQHPVEEYGRMIVGGLNEFLGYTEDPVVILDTTINDESGEFVIGFDTDEPVPSMPDDPYTFEDNGNTFTLGVVDESYLIIETDIDDTDEIDEEEHVGEAISCLIRSSAENKFSNQ